LRWTFVVLLVSQAYFVDVAWQKLRQFLDRIGLLLYLFRSGLCPW